jgi:uroporphyrinogen III methyltransferase/synthase
MREGKVYLVGAGPGDPALITIKGLECLKKADVVIYDRLVDKSLLDIVRPDTEKIFVGKASGYHTIEQAEINQLLVKKAQAGKTVVRLKGGDPFLLGRGGEEAEALATNQVPFEVVPGVSSAIAVPAYAGIPLTHRNLASSFSVITGHEATAKTKSSVSWQRIATGADTLVLLMGIGNLAKITTELIKNGRAPSTPVALIHRGTTPKQQTLVGTLENIVEIAKQSNFKPPAVIVVGEVVRLRKKLQWFENRPLFGKNILVTRALHQVGELSRLLMEYGAVPVEMPLIKIRAPSSWKKLDRAILNLGSYHWIVFTSVNGVKMFFQRLYALDLDARWFKDIRIGVIGPATAEAIARHGLHPDYMPEKYTSQGFLANFDSQNITGCRVLLPRTDIATRELPDGIAKLGAEVYEVTTYRTTSVKANPKRQQMLLNGEIDIITLTSPSTVANLLTLLGSEWQTIDRTKVVCIGPTTAAAATEAGLRVDIVAEEHTIYGLVEAMETYFQRKGEG